MNALLGTFEIEITKPDVENYECQPNIDNVSDMSK